MAPTALSLSSEGFLSPGTIMPFTWPPSPVVPCQTPRQYDNFHAITFYPNHFIENTQKPTLPNTTWPVTLTALRSAGHLENVQPGTAADVSYKS